MKAKVVKASISSLSFQWRVVNVLLCLEEQIYYCDATQDNSVAFFTSVDLEMGGGNLSLYIFFIIYMYLKAYTSH